MIATCVEPQPVVRTLEARTQDGDQGVATVAEAETLLNKEADAAAEKYSEGPWNFD
jgi:hypothetical protein